MPTHINRIISATLLFNRLTLHLTTFLVRLLLNVLRLLFTILGLLFSIFRLLFALFGLLFTTNRLHNLHFGLHQPHFRLYNVQFRLNWLNIRLHFSNYDFLFFNHWLHVLLIRNILHKNGHTVRNLLRFNFFLSHITTLQLRFVLFNVWLLSRQASKQRIKRNSSRANRRLFRDLPYK